MPILVGVNELEPGMILAASVVNNYTVLLPHGRKLNEYDIRALTRKLPDVMVRVIDPVLDNVVEFDDDSADRHVAHEVRRNISQVARKVSASIRGGVALNADNISGINDVIQEMLTYLSENPVTTAVMEQSNGWGDYLQEHAANVFYLSLVIGNTLRNYIKQERERLSHATVVHNAMNLTPLATAALFHDIGMVPLEDLYTNPAPLSSEQRRQVRQHPAVGAAMLGQQIDPMARQIVQCHHENHDGSGYPNALAGDQVNVFARILRVADSYAAGVSTRIFANAKSPIRTLHEMVIGRYRPFYDPIVLKVFASIVQPLPIGAKLQLADGRWAVVVRHDRTNPFSPEIMIAYDKLGDPIAPDELEKPFHLGQRPDIEPVAFGSEDLTFLTQTSEPAALPQDAAAPTPPVSSDCDELFCYLHP